MGQIDNLSAGSIGCSTRIGMWRPELRRAVMKVRPEYFTWSAQQQERYGTQIPRGDWIALNEFLAVELFGRACLARTRSAFEEDRLLEVMAPLVGVGTDYFCLTDRLEEDWSLADFDTVGAFDEFGYRCQPQISDGVGQFDRGGPYRGSIYLLQAQLYLNGRFHCARLWMAAAYIHARLCDVTEARVNELVPYRWIRGKNHGKVEGKHWLWDMRIDANGQESVVTELQRRMWNYERERFDALRTEWDAAARRCVYLVDESQQGGRLPQVHVVFSDKTALKAVRFRSFVEDCHAIEAPAQQLEQTVQEEEALYGHFARAQHEDVLRTYDAKVIHLRDTLRVAFKSHA